MDCKMTSNTPLKTNTRWQRDAEDKTEEDANKAADADRAAAAKADA